MQNKVKLYKTYNINKQKHQSLFSSMFNMSGGLQTHQGGKACLSLGQNSHAEEVQQELPI